MCLVSAREMMADEVVGKVGGYVSSEGLNGTIGIARLGNTSVANVLSVSVTDSRVGCNPPVLK